jgi:hypothetical protein
LHFGQASGDGIGPDGSGAGIQTWPHASHRRMLVGGRLDDCAISCTCDAVHFGHVAGAMTMSGHKVNFCATQKDLKNSRVFGHGILSWCAMEQSPTVLPR